MTIVRVYTDVGEMKPVHLLAKIFDTRGDTNVIRYLSPTNEVHNGKQIYRYEDDTYEIKDESISQYMETSDEEDLGYKRLDDGGFTLDHSDSDSDYVPDSEEDSESSCVTDDEVDDCSGEDDEDEYWSDEE